MYVIHIALGGCLKAPPVPFGVTEDTGGHIAYVLGAAAAQAARPGTERVEIVTRQFNAPGIGWSGLPARERVADKLDIVRLATGDRRYLSKSALDREVPALIDAFLAHLGRSARRPDIVHAHFADAARLAIAAKRRFGCKVFYTPHSLGAGKPLDGPAGPALARRIADERIALKEADAIIVSSRDEAEHQLEAYGVDISGRVHRISPGLTSECATPADLARAASLVDPHLAQPGRPLILAIARPVRRKNLGALARAYVRDPALRHRANLVVLAGQRGPREEREAQEVVGELRAILGEADLAGRVVMPDRHDRSLVAGLYALAAARRGVFVNPSRHEPFGLTLVEAAQHGLPVVATDRGGPVDILGEIGHGRLVDPDDDAAIARGIRALLDHPPAWRAAARNAAGGIGTFDWAIWARRVDRLHFQMSAPVRAPAGTRLLACDIDGTLTGNAAAAERFARWSDRRTIPFAVATGRCISEARGILDAWNLPMPDIFISAVGTEIHRKGPDGHWRLCSAYAAHLSADWQRGGILAALRECGADLQPEIEQRPWKLGCFGDAAEAERISRHMALRGLAVRVVASHGRLIDLVAPRGGKAAAVAFAARGLGLDLGDCIAAGDSGNDADMLSACGAAIVVGNALPELDRMVAGTRLHRTQACHADGVLEGLARLGLAREAQGRRRRPVAVAGAS